MSSDDTMLNKCSKCQKEDVNVINAKNNEVILNQLRNNPIKYAHLLKSPDILLCASCVGNIIFETTKSKLVQGNNSISSNSSAAVEVMFEHSESVGNVGKPEKDSSNSEHTPPVVLTQSLQTNHSDQNDLNEVNVQNVERAMPKRFKKNYQQQDQQQQELQEQPTFSRGHGGLNKIKRFLETVEREKSQQKALQSSSSSVESNDAKNSFSPNNSLRSQQDRALTPIITHTSQRPPQPQVALTVHQSPPSVDSDSSSNHSSSNDQPRRTRPPKRQREPSKQSTQQLSQNSQENYSGHSNMAAPLRPTIPYTNFRHGASGPNIRSSKDIHGA